MTLNHFCITEGEQSGTRTTHLYLQLSVAFREAHVHKLTVYTVGGCSNEEKRSEMVGDEEIYREK